MQTGHVIDCATTPILQRGPTDTLRFDGYGNAAPEHANAATNEGDGNLSFWKLSNQTICWTARCLPCPCVENASRCISLPRSSIESSGCALSREARHL